MRAVLSNGCWDVCHPGHLEHFYQAKRMGDYLVVSVTCDESVRREKGAGRPLFNQDQRSGFLKAIAIIDRVVIVDSAMDALKKVMPQVFVKGPDYVGRIAPEHERFCRENGIEIRFTDGPKYSSSALINELRHG